MKEIAIVSKSLIVNELLKLIFKNRNEKIDFIDSEAIENLSDRVVIVDDSIDDLENSIRLLQGNNNTIILLGEADCDVDSKVAKPFLPQDIEVALENAPLPQKSTTKITTNVLDPDEVAHIKALMALDDDEDYEEEEELTPFELLQIQESFVIKGREAKEFLYEIKAIKTKELKDLLKGAKVKIKVTFKESDDE
jgi:hypothetical protein